MATSIKQSLALLGGKDAGLVALLSTFFPAEFSLKAAKVVMGNMSAMQVPLKLTRIETTSGLITKVHNNVYQVLPVVREIIR